MATRVTIVLSAAVLAFTALALPQEDPNADDYQCISSWHKYDTWYEETGRQDSVTTYSTRVFDTVITDANVPYTTLCDGRPRALQRYPLITTATTATYDPPETRTGRYEYTTNLPDCTINEVLCTSLSSSYESAYSDYITNSAAYPTEQPHCTTPTTPAPEPPRPSCDDTNVGLCFIHGGRVNKLYYWPVTTVDGDFCAQNGSTITPTPTDPNGAPNTAVVDGFTFTSPTNYFSVEQIEGYLHTTRRRQTPCGPPAKTGVVLPLDDTFQSTRGYIGGYGQFSFNFHDFQTPVPAAAVDGQRRPCASYNGCTTIEAKGYVPQVFLPTAFVAEDQDWVKAGCKPTSGTALQIQTRVNLEQAEQTVVAEGPAETG